MKVCPNCNVENPKEYEECFNCGYVFEVSSHHDHDHDHDHDHEEHEEDVKPTDTSIYTRTSFRDKMRIMKNKDSKKYSLMILLTLIGIITTIIFIYDVCTGQKYISTTIVVFVIGLLCYGWAIKNISST